MLSESYESSSEWNDNVEEWLQSVTHLPHLPMVTPGDQHSLSKVTSQVDASEEPSQRSQARNSLSSLNEGVDTEEKLSSSRNSSELSSVKKNRHSRTLSEPLIKCQTSTEGSRRKLTVSTQNSEGSILMLPELEKQKEREAISPKSLTEAEKMEKELLNVKSPKTKEWKTARASFRKSQKTVLSLSGSDKKEMLPLSANPGHRRSWSLFFDGDELTKMPSGWRNRNERRRYKAKYKCSRKKKTRDFKFIRLEQIVVQQEECEISTMKFNCDGKLLATGGSDAVLRIWTVVGTQMDRERWCGARYEKTPGGGVHKYSHWRSPRKGEVHPPSGSIINPIPYREYHGHKLNIIDIDWSHKRNYILTASEDETVMLWNPRVEKCISIFQHADIVPSIRFHPTDYNYFLSGSFDSIIRLWNIRDHRVVAWKNLDTLVTAVAFSPNGSFIAAGLWNGLCSFYNVDLTRYDKLQYHNKVSCRSGRKSGQKVTSIEYLQISKQGEMDHPDLLQGSNWCLVTTSDSRIRLYSLENYQINLHYKYKSLKNREWLGASFTQDGKYVICGSDGGAVYLWDSNFNRNIKPSTSFLTLRRRRSHCKTKSHQRVKVTGSGKLRVAICAPRQTLQYVNKPQVTDLLERPAIKHILLSADEHGVIRVFVNYSSNPGSVMKDN